MIEPQKLAASVTLGAGLWVLILGYVGLGRIIGLLGATWLWDGSD